MARAGVLAQFAAWAAENCRHLLVQDPDGSDLGAVLRNIGTVISDAVRRSGSAEVESALQSLCLGDGSLPLGDPAFWQRLQSEVAEPLAAALAEDTEKTPARQAQLAVEAAEALATRPCAHACCTSIAGPSEAATPRGKLCSGCRRVRYCGPRCQKADWQAHKAACRELARQRAASSALAEPAA